MLVKCVVSPWTSELALSDSKEFALAGGNARGWPWPGYPWPGGGVVNQPTIVYSPLHHFVSYPPPPGGTTDSHVAAVRCCTAQH